MRLRLDSALIVVGYCIVAVGSGMMLWVYRFYVHERDAVDVQLYQLGGVISAVLLVSAWWSILPSLSSVDGTHLGRRSFRMFSVGAAILAVGYVGEVRDWAPVNGFGPIIASWVVTIVGLCVAAPGFWGIARSAVQQDSGTEYARSDDLPSVGEHPPRGSRASILIGYVILALGTAIGEWVNRGYSDHFMRGVLAYDTAVVVSFALIGIAWWLCLGELPPSARRDRVVRRSLRIFGVASATLAVGNLLLVGAFDSDQVLNGISLVLCAAGLVAVTAGFWNAAKRSDPALESTPVIPPVPRVPQS